MSHEIEIDGPAMAVIRRRLRRQPYVAQVLIDIMARTDLPSFEPAAMRHDPLPPEKGKLVGLFGDCAFFHLAEQRQSVLQVKHPALPFIKLIEYTIFVTRVVDRALLSAHILQQVKI